MLRKFIWYLNSAIRVHCLIDKSTFNAMEFCYVRFVILIDAPSSKVSYSINNKLLPRLQNFWDSELKYRICIDVIAINTGYQHLDW